MSSPPRLSAFQIIKLLGEKWKQSAKGFLTLHLSEVLGLTPEVIRIALIPFEAQITAAGVLTGPAVGTRINSDYDFELTGLVASFQEPGTSPEDLASITFNMREAGRNFDIFDTGPINLMNLASTVGPGNVISFTRGLYLFRGGSEIRPIFALSTTNPVAVAAVARAINVMLIGNMIRRK